MANPIIVLPNKNIKDLTGKTFGRWTVISFVETRHRCGAIWLCRCSCEQQTERLVRAGTIVNGTSKSCGCLSRETAKALWTTHGKSNSRVHECWVNMIQRCCNEQHPSYKNYGGRGINVCQEWRESFEKFYKHIGDPPSLDHSIDRYPNNDGNYEPGNVRWATWNEQTQNQRRTKILTWQGESLCRTEWAKRLGVSPTTLTWRIENWGMENAMAKQKPVRLSRTRQ